VLKQSTSLTQHIRELIRVSMGLDRIFEMLSIFLILQHITACVWIFIGRYDGNDSKRNWIYRGNFVDLDPFELYMTSMYFSVTTVLTVGYGDISAHNPGEKLFCIVLMVIGVLLFSFATGSLTSMISSRDQTEALLNDKIAVLNQIQLEYSIDPDLYNKIQRTLQYGFKKIKRDAIKFMEELPQSLKQELSMVINRQMYTSVEFFQDKDKTFLTWIAVALRPMKCDFKEYIFREGEVAQEGTAVFLNNLFSLFHL
jgi:Ion channel